MSFPSYRQLDQIDCGLTCLHMIAKHYGRSLSLQTLRGKAQINRDGFSQLGLAQAAESIGLRTMGAQVPFEVLAKDVPLPCVVHWHQNLVVHEITGCARQNQPAWLRQIRGGRQPADSLTTDAGDAHSMSHESRSTRSSERRGTVRVAGPGTGLINY